MTTAFSIRTLLFFLIFTPLSISAQLTRRVAYVIGNTTYSEGALYNPVNDVRDFSKTLSQLGFKVKKFENVAQLSDFARILAEYGQELKQDAEKTVGLFYYSGHGFQFNGTNYMVPTKAKLNAPNDIPYQAVSLDLLMSPLHEAGNAMNIIILDACRATAFWNEEGSFSPSQSIDNQKIKPRKGLAAMDAPAGTFIAFATSPGNVASDGEGLNGIYTQELIKAITLPDLPIEQIFKRVRTQVKALTYGEQIPWENSSLEAEFYFNRSNSATTEGTIMTIEEEKRPISERLAYDLCSCLRGLTAVLDKIDKMPASTSGEKLERLAYEAQVTLEQSESCIKNLPNRYPSVPTTSEESQAMEVLKTICSDAYQFMTNKKK